jgi:hypothetical protein
MFMAKHSISPFYLSLGQDPEDYALVDFTARGKALFCQSLHRKRLVGGYVARGSEGRHPFLKESEIVRHIQANLPPGSGEKPDFVGGEARKMLREHNIRHLIFPKPVDPSPFRDMLLLFLPGPPRDAETLMGGIAGGQDRVNALSRELVQSAEDILASKGPMAVAGFALTTRFFFASHPEFLPANTIGRLVPESERIVADGWSLPVTYEDNEIRVYSVDP